MEEGVEEEDYVWADRDGVEEDGVGFGIERVGHEGGLDHDQRVVDVRIVQYVSVDVSAPKLRLIRRRRTGRKPSHPENY